jgi:hypothetical protein
MSYLINLVRRTEVGKKTRSSKSLRGKIMEMVKRGLKTMSNTNWLFYAIISLNFQYHLKRTIMFIVSFYGMVMLQYTSTLMYIDATLLLIHLFAIISTMLFSIGIAYSKGNIIRKIIVYGLFIFHFLTINKKRKLRNRTVCASGLKRSCLRSIRDLGLRNGQVIPLRSIPTF